MSRKIQYKFRRYKPSELFGLLIDSIDKGRLQFPFPYDNSAWQPVFIEFFRKLGEKSGYKVPRDMEWFKVDSPWIVDLPDHRIVELIVEHEDDGKLESVLSDVRKLGPIKAHTKGAIYFPSSKDIDNDLKKIGTEIRGVNDEIKQVPAEKWLIIAINDVPKGKITFRGYEFDSRGICSQIGDKEFEQNQIKK